MVQDGKSNGFGNVVILLAARESSLQRLLDQVRIWIGLAGMSWIIEKSELTGTRHSYFQDSV